jgi:hypothetical protein
VKDTQARANLQRCWHQLLLCAPLLPAAQLLQHPINENALLLLLVLAFARMLECGNDSLHTQRNM